MEIFIKCEDKIIKTNSNAISKSSLLQYLYSSYPKEVIQLNYDYEFTKKIIEWLERHELLSPIIPPFPNKDYNYKEVFSSWEIEYFSRLLLGNDISYLVNFLNLANTLEVPLLLNQGCYYLSCIIGVRRIPLDKFMILLKIENNIEKSELSNVDNQIQSLIEEKIEIDKKRSLKQNLFS